MKNIIVDDIENELPEIKVGDLVKYYLIEKPDIRDVRKLGGNCSRI